MLMPELFKCKRDLSSSLSEVPLVAQMHVDLRCFAPGTVVKNDWHLGLDGQWFLAVSNFVSAVVV